MRARMLRAAAAGLLALGAACSAPDYTPVRDWARDASLVADLAVPPASEADGVAAMQEALATYLLALGRMADDGTVPFMEDPFVALAARARAADPAGGEAVAALGAGLRRAARGNWRAPRLRDAIATFDPHVQALVAALAGRFDPAGAPPGAEAALRADYAGLIRQVGAGHALLAARTRDITSEDAVERIRAEEDRLRRAALALPRPALPVP